MEFVLSIHVDVTILSTSQYEAPFVIILNFQILKITSAFKDYIIQSLNTNVGRPAYQIKYPNSGKCLLYFKVFILTGFKSTLYVIVTQIVIYCTLKYNNPF